MLCKKGKRAPYFDVYYENRKLKVAIMCTSNGCGYQGQKAKKKSFCKSII